MFFALSLAHFSLAKESEKMRAQLKFLSEPLRSAASEEERLLILNAFPTVMEFLRRSPSFHMGLAKATLSEQVACKQVIAIGQMERLSSGGDLSSAAFKKFLETMTVLDSFYKEIGGIVGYQEKILSFLEGNLDERQSEIVQFHTPDFIDIAQESPDVLQWIEEGIRSLPRMAEMYPLGGAADRLHLVDESTGLELPAAKLAYGGRPLFEGLIRDLQAREFLYFKLYGRQIEIPIAIMTSEEKDNHRHILRICESHQWFGRSKESFQIFSQPLVPSVDTQGNWCLLGAFTLLLKPGGHGALWKRALDSGAFQWLVSQGKELALVRQINNPVAGLDYGLLTFFGLGVNRRAVFGFASCPRIVQAAEGVNVVVEKKNGDLALTNIEYCDFEKYGIVDLPLKEGEPYSRFSSNTNILFADLRAVERAVKICPFPGLLANFKEASYTSFCGKVHRTKMARLESTMQNIADVFVEKQKPQSTFVTYNHRHKTIATAKKAFVPGGALRETPEECFYMQLQAARELLEVRCGFSLPEKYSLEKYLEAGPDVAFLYHPALGPLYALIAQKISCGNLALGSEVEVEIVDLEIKNLNLSGSLAIRSEQPLGALDAARRLVYSDQTGRCVLRGVTVRNRGVDWGKSAPFWKGAWVRKESLQIDLKGCSEFIAQDVCFEGNQHFEVPDGISLVVSEKKGRLIFEEKPFVSKPFWLYRWEETRGVIAQRGEDKNT